MSRSAVELDFFRMEKESSSKSQSKNLFDRRRNFRDIQSVISKLNPQLLKTVIASGSIDHTSNVAKSAENGNNLFLASKPSFSVPSTPKLDETLFPALPVYSSAFGSNASSGSERTPETTPMTIFYNGSVAVFDVPRHKAENIFKLAEKEVSKTVESADPKLAVSSTDQTQLLDSLNGDLPIARRKSLQRFMEKRKERLTILSPYGCPTGNASSGQNTSGH